VPAQLDWITAQLLAKDPSARPATAAAARAGLLAALGPDATAMLPAGAGDEFGRGYNRRRRRSPTIAEVVLGAALAAALAGLTALLVSGGTDQAASPAHPAATTHPVRTTAPERPHRSHQEARCLRRLQRRHSLANWKRGSPTAR
jgi:hypothetical protein